MKNDLISRTEVLDWLENTMAAVTHLGMSDYTKSYKSGLRSARDYVKTMESPDTVTDYNCSSEPKGELAKIKILLDREEVFKAVERITNEAIEKGLRKSTIQKSLILELGALEPAKIEYEYENYDPSGVGQTFSP